MDNHLEAMHNDLENLRELLRNEGYTIDANTLMEVCVRTLLYFFCSIYLYNYSLVIECLIINK